MIQLIRSKEGLRRVKATTPGLQRLVSKAMRPVNPSRFVLALTLGLLPWISGCGPGLLNATVSKKRIAVTRSIPYGGGPRQTLDIILPRQTAADGSPVVVFFYGGSWRSGRKEDYLFVGAALARNDIVCVIPDHRLYPEIRFPDFLRDGARAIAWVQAHVSEYGGD